MLIYVVILLNIRFIKLEYELLIKSFKFRARPPSICFDDIPSVLMHSSSEMSATENNLFESKLKRRYFKLFIIYSDKFEF